MWNRRQLLAIAALLPWAKSQSFANTEAIEDAILTTVKKLTVGKNPTLKLMLPTGSESNVAPLTAMFRRATGVVVELDVTPVDDINSRLYLAHIRRQPVDLALPATFGIPDLASAGVIRPLAPLLSKDQLREQSLYDLGDAFDNQRYGFQTDGDVYLMFYNRQMLQDEALVEAYQDRFGRELRPARTFTELDQMIEFFHAPSENRFGAALFRTPTYIVWEWWMRFHAYGGLPFSTSMVPKLTCEAGVHALEDMIRVSEFLTPGAATDGLVDNWEVYSRGNVFANIGWGGSQKFFMRGHNGLAAGVEAALPPGGGENGEHALPYFNWGWSYAVPAMSSAPELAALFARYATLPRVSTEAVRDADGFFDPFHAEHYDDPIIRKAYGDQFLGVHREALSRALPDLYLAGRNQYVEDLSKNLLEAHAKKVSAVEALRAAETQWEVITGRLGRDEQIRQWRRLLARYPDWLTSA